MKRLLFALLALQAFALPGSAALGEGATAPDFTVKASRAGKAFDFSLTEALKKGPVVVYFFPAAFTSGCDIQAHEFAVRQEKFIAAGATVVGISLDRIDRLNEFSADPDYCGGKVAVGSDVGGKIAKAYDLRVVTAPPGSRDTQGVPLEHGLVERFTFVITPDQKVAATIGGVSPTTNVTRALEVVQKLAEKPTTAKLSAR
jgi:peroxiredoxin